MAFVDFENSNDEALPVRMYAFTLGSATFRFNASDKDITIGGYKWKSTSISDDGVRVSGEPNTDTLSITVPVDLAPVVMFAGTPPSAPIGVRIYLNHEGDTDVILIYDGEVVQVDYPTPGTARITCDSLGLSMQRDGLRLGYQRGCPYALYNVWTCRAPQEDFAIECRIVAVDAGKITVEGLDKPDGWLNGGFIKWTHPQRGVELRGIEQQVGSDMTMFGLSDGLYFGLSITAYPGCDRTTKTCAEKFDNLNNYGGAPDMPGKSPFDGDPVF